MGVDGRRDGLAYLAAMSVEAMQVFTALLALAAAGLGGRRYDRTRCSMAPLAS